MQQAKTLQLSLIKCWFEMTKSGTKTEDYRDTNDYWYSRLCLYKGEKKKQKWWRYFFENDYSEDKIHDISFAHFDSNIMTLGYPKSTDTERILKVEHKGIEIRTGNPEWGAEPGKIYFVIKHGNIL